MAVEADGRTANLHITIAKLYAVVIPYIIVCALEVAGKVSVFEPVSHLFAG